MIDDSEPWRADLKRFASSIDKARNRPVKSDRAVARLERDHMYGFFALRRLMECYKLSSATLDVALPVTQYPFRAKSHIALMNWDEIDRHYDFSRPTRTTMRLRDRSNQVIHSDVFVLAFERESRLSGLFVSSEYRRGIASSHCYELCGECHEEILSEPVYLPSVMEVLRSRFGGASRVQKLAVLTRILQLGAEALKRNEGVLG